MKTYLKVICEKHCTSSTKCGQKIEKYIKNQRYFDFKEGLGYSVSVPNFNCCKNKLIDALLWIMEHEINGM